MQNNRNKRMKKKRRRLQLNGKPLFRFKKDGNAGQGPSTDPTLTTITITNGTSVLCQVYH